MRRAACVAAAVILLHLVLVLPEYPPAWTARTLVSVPLELPVLLLALVALPAHRRLTSWVCGILALVLGAVLVMKLADLASYTAFGRPFDPVIDRHLPAAGLELLRGSLGPSLTVLAMGGALAALALLVWGFALAFGMFARLDAPRWAALPLAAAALLLAALAGIDATARTAGHGIDPPGHALNARLVHQHVGGLRAARRALAAFRMEALDDPLASAPPRLDRLGGRDVLVVYVESYGRSSLAHPLYAPTHRATLAEAVPALAAAGYAMRSAWLTAPIAGGQSWLAHATLAAGLAVGDQHRYAALLASRRQTLFHLAGRAGYHTAAVVPAITRAWPEGDLLGFRTVLGAADLGYRGPAFNWVTMPDQYTLSAFRDRIETGGRPLFAQIVLISSHAPWVPIPPLLDWQALGDGRDFEGLAIGDPPRVVWRDPDAVRDQYRQAVDYTLRSVLSFAARQHRPLPLIVLLGDHPPAGFVAQMPGRDVPVHLIGPPEAIAAIEDWTWTPGLLPGPDAPVWPMAAFRDRFLAAFSSGGEGGA